MLIEGQFLYKRTSTLQCKLDECFVFAHSRYLRPICKSISRVGYSAGYFRFASALLRWIIDYQPL